MNMIMAIETRRKPVFSYSSFFLLRSFLLVIAKTKGTTKKKEIMKDEIGEVLNNCKIIENGIIIDPEIIKYQKR